MWFNVRAMDSKAVERTFVVVDIENLCGGSAFVRENQAAVRDQFLSQPRGVNISVLACGSYAAESCPELAWDWNPARLFVRPGVDGADSALLDVLREDPAADRSARVEIWSGDHIFAEAALKLRRRGAEVSVFAPAGSLSRKLAGVASRVITLPSVDRLGDAAACGERELHPGAVMRTDQAGHRGLFPLSFNRAVNRCDLAGPSEGERE